LAICISCAAPTSWTVLMDSFLAFFSVSVIVIVTPGPDTRAVLLKPTTCPSPAKLNQAQPSQSK
jgi:hypothetical protein